jgi:hypothetical protein
MKITHKQIWMEVLTWIVAEVILNCVGLDNLADYGEFALAHKAKAVPPTIAIVLN